MQTTAEFAFVKLKIIIKTNCFITNFDIIRGLFLKVKYDIPINAKCLFIEMIRPGLQYTDRALYDCVRSDI